MTKPHASLTQPCFTVSGRAEPGYIRHGLPIAKGVALDANQLALVDSEGIVLNSARLTANTRWGDGSVKWLDIEGVFNAGHTIFVKQIDSQESNASEHEPSKSIQGSTTFSIDDLGLTLNLNATLLVKNKSTPFNGAVAHEHQITSSVSDYRSVILKDDQFPYLEIELAVRYCPITKEAFIDIAVRNLNASTHPNGTWDLGDPNNLTVQNLSLTASFTKSDKGCLTVNNELVTETDSDQPIKLHQMASGGDNFQSPVHLNRHNKVEITTQGFEVLDAAGQQMTTGLRANPLATFNQAGHRVFMSPKYFWENFPATLVMTKTEATLGLFPEPTELQAGESKSWQVYVIGQTAHNTNVSEPISATLNADYVNETDVLSTTLLTNRSVLKPLVSKGVEGTHSFFNKREVCDEYGWRNFGELYADHEAIGQPTDPTFISHYNNQYDPIFGTLVQGLSNPEEPWAAVAQPLAQHVMDIDIYNTDLDKPEYNGGLFWHTDHYLPAATCTHRTYSVSHESVYDGHQGGGGPGGQHCYTSGLTLYSLLYSDLKAKSKVIQLTHWIRRFYNGDGSFLSRLHRFASVDLKPNQLTNIGIVKDGYRYPLDRGIGNYINALCDSFELTGDTKLLTEVDFIIRNTVGLADNLTERQLDNVEESWFYVVFLASTAKYLLMKEQLNQNDASYAYARAALLKYADWMLENEKPYLTEPEKLEFPNDTWAAQDIRKANIMYYAAYFNASKASEFTKKGDDFLDYVTNKLTPSAEAETTRILAILMQNYGVAEKLKGKHSSFEPITLSEADLAFNGQSAVKRLLQDLPKLLTSFSVKKEWAWIKNRLPTKNSDQEALS